MTDTVTLEKSQYIRLVGTYSEVLVKDAADDEPRTLELKATLEELVNAAKAANLQLDDAFVAQNAEAKRVREAIDLIMPEFQSLMEKAAKRKALMGYFKEQIDAMPNNTEQVHIPVTDAMVLTGLAQAR